jgi:hypothetical protein
MRRRRSRDRLDDHANRCGIAVYQAARFAYATSGSKGRLSEKCVVGIHSYASARHAIPRRSSEPGDLEIRRLARGATIRNLRNATFCPNGATRPRRVTNALTEEWSNGQTEGHINRLKTLKRAMYGAQAPNFYAPECCPSNCQFSTESEADASYLRISMWIRK